LGETKKELAVTTNARLGWKRVDSNKHSILIWRRKKFKKPKHMKDDSLYANKFVILGVI